MRGRRMSICELATVQGRWKREGASWKTHRRVLQHLLFPMLQRPFPRHIYHLEHLRADWYRYFQTRAVLAPLQRGRAKGARKTWVRSLCRICGQHSLSDLARMAHDIPSSSMHCATPVVSLSVSTKGVVRLVNGCI